MRRESPLFKEELQVLQREIHQEGLPEEMFGFTVNKVICLGSLV